MSDCAIDRGNAYTNDGAGADQQIGGGFAVVGALCERSEARNVCVLTQNPRVTGAGTEMG